VNNSIRHDYYHGRIARYVAHVNGQDRFTLEKVE
jgi:hypothetical protein